MVHSNSLAHTFIIGLLLAALSGCEGYAVSVNDNPVYNPPALFTEFRLVDSALQECVQQTIEDRGVTDANQLTQLNCSSAGIESLEGISTFSALRAISLNSNALTDIEPLKTLSRLEILMLKDNDVRSAEPLLSLLRLKELDLRGNAQLACGDARQLADHSEGDIRLPAHCE
ncbi:leucine-rich repeat domain-containing protein [Marinimicrobium sp. ARAG 43.8]|uniref:leucine-rich repeat domain-containing protein n=1 Tax=Marinimicrobium sp. ARAG 43.8 TaxID=3418719 RepID=UPI003CEE66BB